MTALLIGYARVSTDEQDLTVQRNALAVLGVSPERTYVDHGLTGSGPGYARRSRPAARATRSSSPSSTDLPGPCPTRARSLTT